MQAASLEVSASAALLRAQRQVDLGMTLLGATYLVMLASILGSPTFGDGERMAVGGMTGGVGLAAAMSALWVVQASRELRAPPAVPDTLRRLAARDALGLLPWLLVVLCAGVFFHGFELRLGAAFPPMLVACVAGVGVWVIARGTLAWREHAGGGAA